VLLLKFYTQHGRFPRGRAELPDEAVTFVAGQVQLPASDWASTPGLAGRSSTTGGRFGHLGFRECSVVDAEKLTGWLADHVALRERRPDLVHAELLARCRAESIEPPTAGRCARIVRGALHAAEEMLTLRVHARLADGSVERILGLEAGDDVDGPEVSDNPRLEDRSVLAAVKAAPGNVSLETMLTEIDKLLAVRAVGREVAVQAHLPR